MIIDDSEEMVEIVIEVKAGYEISKAEAEKYANKYVDAFIGSSGTSEKPRPFYGGEG